MQVHTRCFLKRLAWLVAAMAVPLANMATAAPQPGYYRQPAIQGDTVVFVAEGDLWRVNVNGGSGGIAQRLTTNLAEESLPRISPDGKTIAFTARYEGPAEVYVMPINGGLPTRLTHEGDNARVQGFTNDGKVMYTTARWSGKPMLRMFTVDPATRQVTAMPLAEAAEGCYLGNDFMFTRLPLGSDNVKNYRGGLVQRIWKFDGKAEAALLTNEDGGMSRQPMCATGAGKNRLYFLSDRDGTMNIWSVSSAGTDVRQHTKHREFDIRSASISADGARIVYQRGADIYVHDVSSDADRVLPISLQSDFEHTRTRWVKNPWDYVTAVEPSPSGDRVVITARGEVFVMPVGIGRRVEIVRDANVRAREAIFSTDGKAIFAFSDQTGEFELTRFPANGVAVGEAIPKALTSKASILRRHAYPSPDGKWIAHDDLDRKLWLTEVATGLTRLIDRAALDHHHEVSWSPDSHFIVFNKAAANQFEQLFLYELATEKQTAISSDRYDAQSAAFSPDGKWLYFLANRNLQSTVTAPWGQRNPSPNFDRQARIYAYSLDPAARWPFLPKDELWTPPKDEGDKKAVAPAKNAKNDPAADAKAGAAEARPALPTLPKANPITFDGLRARLYEVPIAAGNYSALSTDGKRLYFLSTDAADKKKSLRSVAIEAPNPAPLTADVFLDDIRSYRLTQDRKKLMLRKQNEIYLFDAGKSPPPPGDFAKFAVNTRDWMIELNPRQEWLQMFNDAWRMHRDYFYDKNMHGANWATARQRYQPLLDRVTDRAEVNDVIGQMISEVRALHSQIGVGDIRRGQDTIDVAGLAADVAKTADGFRITRIFEGDTELIEERSPLTRAEVNVRVGETITAINGVAATSAANLGELLRNQADKQVLMSVLAVNGTRRDLIVSPINPFRDRSLRYLAWERERAEQVDAASANKIGYVHLQAMGPNDIARWAREFYPVYRREGLIIDLRNNNGGNIDSWIIEKLQRRAWSFWQARGETDTPSNQQLAFRGHVVAIIDANTYSDGETLAQGLKRLGIASLIGKTTAGAGIWLSDQNRLRDNGIARVAENGSFVDNGSGSKGERVWITEGVGVKPDIEVDNLPFATFNGRDAQLERAVSYLKEMIAKEPISSVVAPAFPVLTR